jgi:hypothetical protein
MRRKFISTRNWEVSVGPAIGAGGGSDLIVGNAPYLVKSDSSSVPREGDVLSGVEVGASLAMGNSFRGNGAHRSERICIRFEGS